VAPALSIVTVCLNDRAGLLRTLDSVARQAFRDFELVVVDGGSTDGSTELLRSRAPSIARWVSERDSGVYDVQNKGVGMATGTWLLFLNAGDHLASDDALAQLFAAVHDEDLVYCDVVYSKQGIERPSRPPGALLLPYLLRSGICTQATIFRRTLVEKVGRHDTSLRILGDYDLILKLLLVERARARHVPVTLSVHYQDGLSTRPGSQERLAAERALVEARYLPPLVQELHADWLRLRRRALTHRLRALFRRARGRPG
jgi:glycosyltransferase involved in cell wall biosynthesis